MLPLITADDLRIFRDAVGKSFTQFVDSVMRTSAPISHFEHVLILFQENHTPDKQGLCDADQSMSLQTKKIFEINVIG